MKLFKNLFFLLCIVVILSSCRTIREAKAFARCEFRTKDISQLNLGSTSLLTIQDFSDLGLGDMAKLGLEFQKNSLPLKITYSIEVRNPNTKTAALEQTDWILELDKQKVLSGTTQQRIEVASQSTAVFPITTQLDVKDILNKKSIQSIVNLVAGIKGNSEGDTGIRLKIKPRFRIAGIRMGYPGYIKVGKEFKAE